MNVNIVTKLYTVFTNKKWTDNEGNELVFSNFCTLLSNLSNEQQELIIELAERYTWITLSEYQSRLISVFKSIELEKINGLRKIVLFPIMKPEDEKKTKSGHAILYMVRAIKPLLSNYKNIEFYEIESYENLKETNFRLKPNEAMFLLDDFLGSGETIKSTIDEILTNPNLHPSQLNVLSIAIQSESINYLVETNISYYSELIEKKGISDFYDNSKVDEKIEIMKEIERLIPGNHFSLGYNQSEGLITLMRTPDNTFPIFWKEYKKNNQKYEAPFSRY